MISTPKLQQQQQIDNDETTSLSRTPASAFLFAARDFPPTRPRSKSYQQNRLSLKLSAVRCSLLTRIALLSSANKSLVLSANA